MKTPQMFTKIVALLVLFVVTTTFVNATTSASKTLNKNNVVLVGEAQFSVMFWDIYKSRLFTPSGKYNGINPTIIFEITYQKDITTSQLIKRTIEQWQKMNIEAAKYQPYLTELTSLWPNITSGDRLALQVADDSSHFYFNDNYVGSIKSPNFAPLFLGIWLSPNTTQPDFRKKLLEG